MNLQQHTNPSALEKYSFWWSEVRLVIAALALFLGGVPPLVKFVALPSGPTGLILTVSWIVSGLAAGYLFYRWYAGNQNLFGKKSRKDQVAFAVMVVSGLNLGFTGVTGINIGMALWYDKMVFILVGLIYLWSAWRLYSQWQSNAKKMF